MKPIFLGTLALLLSCSGVNANGINILSEEHHIWGVAGYDYHLHPYLQYDEISFQPISASVSGEYYNPWDSFANPCASSASAGNFGIDVLAMYDSSANVTSSYIFTTDYDHLSLSAFASMEYVLPLGVSLSLDDLTDQTNLISHEFISYWQEDGWQDHFILTKEIASQTNHVYQLSMQASVSEGPLAWGGTSAQSGLRCELSSLPQPVPEPATALLFILGLAVISNGRKSINSTFRVADKTSK